MGKFDAVLRWTAIGAAIGAALALLGGFAGSTPPAPEADQGPLGGILATGWWGGIVGASLGAVVGYNRSSKRE